MKQTRVRGVTTGLKRYKIHVAPLVVRDVRTPRKTVAVEALDSTEAKYAALRMVLDGAGLTDHPASAALDCARVVWVDRDFEVFA
jgi:hypothetical protein